MDRQGHHHHASDNPYAKVYDVVTGNGSTANTTNGSNNHHQDPKNTQPKRKRTSNTNNNTKKKSGGGRGGGGGGGGGFMRPFDTRERGSQSHRVNERTLMSEGFEFLHKAHTVDHRYERLPRLLPPHISGLKSLGNTEVQDDLRLIQKEFNAFEAKVAALLPPGQSIHNRPPLHSDGHEIFQYRFNAIAPLMPAKRRPKASGNGLMSPEEIVATLPGCCRAVRLTRRELIGLKREKDDLEREFMRLRCKFIWQIGEMKRMKRQQDKITRALSEQVATKAKSLESSRRRTTALQDIMTELETRGQTIAQLTRQNELFKRFLQQQEDNKNLSVQELEQLEKELIIGDRVKTMTDGLFGIVHKINKDTKQITIVLEENDNKEEELLTVNQDQVELALLLTPGESYVEKEKQLKQDLFDKIGTFLQSNSNSQHQEEGGVGTSSFRRRRSDLSSMDHPTLPGSSDSEFSESESEHDTHDSEEDPHYQYKKIKRPIPNPREKLIDFTACKIPITPHEAGLLLSPLSELPEKVAAIGPGALQWMTQYLPKKMQEWEQERYEALEMKGEIERLRFQLSKAIEEKEDAQQQAVDHLESIDELVTDMEKLREKLKEAGVPLQQQSSHNHKSKSSSKSKSQSTGSNKNRPRSESDVGEQTDGSPVKRPRIGTGSVGLQEDQEVGNEEEEGVGAGSNADGGEFDGETGERKPRSLRPRRSRSSPTKSPQT